MTTANAHIFVGEDTYTVELDLDVQEILIIWRYRFNRTRGEPVRFDSLDLDIQTLIDRKILKQHGFSVFEQ